MILDRFGNPFAGEASGLENWQFQTGLSAGSVFSQFLPFAREGQELPRPLDFSRLTDEFYRRNAVVYSAIRALSRSASEPIFQACTIDSQGVPQPDDPLTEPLAKLIAQPNEEQEAYEFFEMMIIHLQVAGNAFVHKIRSKQGNVVMLELIRPDIVTIIPQKSVNGRKIATYMVGPVHNRKPVPAEDIVHLRMPDAFDEFWGLSPLFVLAKYGDIDTQSTDFLRSFFLNRGVPSGMLVSKGRVQDFDRQNIKDSWRTQFNGKDGWQTVAVLDQGVEYQALSTGLKDLNLNPVFNQSETRIAMVFGVPPILLGTNSGLERSTFSNFSESRRGFWTETLVPMYTRIVRRLTLKLAREDFGNRRSIKADVSKVAGLQENKEKLRALAIKGYDKALFTVNEAREIMDMPPIPDDQVVGNSLKLGTAAVMVPREQAHQFADLVGDVVTDLVQEEIIETDEDKIKGVGDPNPAIGEPDREDPIEQKIRKAKRLEEEAKRLRKEAKRDAADAAKPTERAADEPIEIMATIALWDENTGDCLEHEVFACPACQAAMEENGPGCKPGDPDYPNCREDSVSIEELVDQILETADEELIVAYTDAFPGNFHDSLVGMIDRIIGGELSVEYGAILLVEMIGQDLRAILSFFELAKAMDEAGKTPDELRAALVNAKSRLVEDDE